MTQADYDQAAALTNRISRALSRQHGYELTIVQPDAGMSKWRVAARPRSGVGPVLKVSGNSALEALNLLLVQWNAQMVGRLELDNATRPPVTPPPPQPIAAAMEAALDVAARETLTHPPTPLQKLTGELVEAGVTIDTVPAQADQALDPETLAEAATRAYRLLDDWIHATKSQRGDADTGVGQAWTILGRALGKS